MNKPAKQTLLNALAIVSLIQLLNFVLSSWLKAGLLFNLYNPSPLSGLGAALSFSGKQFATSIPFWLLFVSGSILLLSTAIGILPTVLALPFLPHTLKPLLKKLDRISFIQLFTDYRLMLALAVANVIFCIGLGLSYPTYIVDWGLGLGIVLNLLLALVAAYLIYGYKISNDKKPTADLRTLTARLYVHSGGMEGAYPVMSEFPYTIGRHEDNHLVLYDDISISKFHAQILYANGVYFLRSLKEERPLLVGTSLDALQKQLSCRLNSQDYFVIGNSVIQFVVE
jgi:hypothetical protein